MDKQQQITWFAGLFEGEGTFNFTKGVPKSIKIQMTDEDVLLRVKEFFGGQIYVCKKQKEHHKDSWIWSITGEKSVELAKEIFPYLLARRQLRCGEYINLYRTASQYQAKRRLASASLREIVREMRQDGLTHQAIADRIGKDRTYVSHILSGKFD